MPRHPIALALLASLTACATPPPHPSQGMAVGQARADGVRDAARAGALPPDWQGQARASVHAQLRDPASAMISGLRNPYGGLVCGMVNARNGFGGYAGPSPAFGYFDATGRLADFRVYSAEGHRDPAFASLLPLYFDCLKAG